MGTRYDGYPAPSTFSSINDGSRHSTEAFQGSEARIVREDGTDAAPNEPGEIYLRGGNVALGYWNNETATRGAFLPDGWLRTGDRFRADTEGRFLYA